MQLYSQIGLVAIPLLGAALIGTNLIQPAMEESGQKAGQLETIHQQYEILEIKLKVLSAQLSQLYCLDII